MGAGILPIALYKGAIYLLLGQERTNLWSDFGGSTSKTSYEKPFNTAIREGYEELNGFLGNEKELALLVKSNFLLKIPHDTYTTYIFNINYSKDLPKYFNNLNSFIEINAEDKIMKNKNILFEKKKIMWLKLKEYKKDKSILEFRSWYKPILDDIENNEKFLIKKIINKRKITTQKVK